MQRIEWRCDGCGDPVEDGAGYVEVLTAERVAYDRELRAWKDANPGPAISGGAILDHPERAPWRVWHRACDPQPGADSYWFTVERGRDLRALLQWTLHLMEKRWIGSTDWSAFLGRRVSRANV